MLYRKTRNLLIYLELGRVLPTLAIIEISMCSFLLKGPGFKLCRTPNNVNPTSGRNLSAALPTGYANSCTTSALNVIDGCRTLKSWLMKAMNTTNASPMTQARIVETGRLGSSCGSTTARTSAYGLLVVSSETSTLASEISRAWESGLARMSSLARNALRRSRAPAGKFGSRLCWETSLSADWVVC